MSVLLADDPLYEELYDVRREAMAAGNLIEGDVTPAIHALRAIAPVHKGKLRDLLGLPAHDRHVFAAGRPHYCVLGYDACEAVFRDPATFSTRVSHHPNPANELTMGILEMDGPMHRGFRRTIQPRFLMPEALGWWRAKAIGWIIPALIGRMRDRGSRADLNLDYCARIPVMTITTAIGLDGDEALRFRDAYLRTSAARLTPAERAEASRTVESLLLGLIAARRAERRDDLISFLLDARLMLPGNEPRPLTDREIMTHARLVMVAGGGTSWRQLGIALMALLTHREQMDAVRADRALVDDAIEESLRWNPTAPVFSRLVERDTVFGGHAMAAGSVVELALGAANRDPARWTAPDTFDIHRDRRTNMAFGLGAHRCLGMNVARVEMADGINALFDAFPDLRLDPAAPAPELAGGLEQRGPSALPVLLG